MEKMQKMIKCAIEKHIPKCSIQTIKDKGTWIKKVFEITLDTGEVVYLKLKVHPEWGDLKHEIAVEKIFSDNGLPAPDTLAIDMSCEIIPYPFLLQERMDGIRLSELINRCSNKDRIAIYEKLGCLYRQMHNIKNDRSGLWSDNPKQILYPISPNDYMYQAEIVNGSGKAALEQGRITRKTYGRAKEIWMKNMRYLKDHQPVLVHGSPFIWTIYLKKFDSSWKVTKLMSLGDVMWWDAAYDIAFLRYPPFAEVGEDEWKAFEKGYGELPETKRILLYAVMQRICSVMGVYMEPDMPQNEKWREKCLKDIEEFLNKIESES